MDKTKNSNAIQIISAVSFLIMIIVNTLANTLPINGQTTGQISNAYPNLFAPAAITFSIWGLIYLLVGGFVLYILGFFRGNSNVFNSELINKIAVIFSISSFANAAWIFAWHYNQIGLSLLLIVVILVCLILINQTLAKEQLTTREKIFVRLPFSVYFGWITVATIANATTLLVSLGWDGFGLSDATWTVIMLCIGAIIGLSVMFKNNDMAYGLVFIWAYAGILLKHLSENGFDGQYPSVIYTTIACIAIFVIAEILLFIRRKKA